MSDTLYSVRQAAEHLGISIHTLNMYVSRGIMPTEGQKVGYARVFTQTDLDTLKAWLATRSKGRPTKATAPPAD